jgi:hypothetical protein
VVVGGHKFDYPLRAGSIERGLEVGIKRDSRPEKVCALSALCALRVGFHRFFMPEVQNCSRSPTIHSRGRCPARSDLRFD